MPIPARYCPESAKLGAVSTGLGLDVADVGAAWANLGSCRPTLAGGWPNLAFIMQRCEELVPAPLLTNRVGACARAYSPGCQGQPWLCALCGCCACSLAAGKVLREYKLMGLWHLDL